MIKRILLLGLAIAALAIALPAIVAQSGLGEGVAQAQTPRTTDQDDEADSPEAPDEADTPEEPETPDQGDTPSEDEEGSDDDEDEEDEEQLLVAESRALEWRQRTWLRDPQQGRRPRRLLLVQSELTAGERRRHGHDSPVGGIQAGAGGTADGGSPTALLLGSGFADARADGGWPCAASPRLRVVTEGDSHPTDARTTGSAGFGRRGSFWYPALRPLRWLAGRPCLRADPGTTTATHRSPAALPRRAFAPEWHQEQRRLVDVVVDREAAGRAGSASPRHRRLGAGDSPAPRSRTERCRLPTMSLRPAGTSPGRQPGERGPAVLVGHVDDASGTGSLLQTARAPAGRLDPDSARGRQRGSVPGRGPRRRSPKAALPTRRVLGGLHPHGGRCGL